MKTQLALVALLILLAGCATPHSGPTVDIGSTLVADAAQSGAVKEAGLIAGAPSSLPVGLALSLGTRAWIMHTSRDDYHCESLAGWTDAVGWGAACNNLAAAMGAMPQISVPLLIGCTVLARKTRKDQMTAWCGDYTRTDLPCKLESLPDEAATARCIGGRMALRGDES